MKFTIYMKTPDAVEYAIENAMDNEVADDEDQYEIRENLKELCSKWFSYGECVGIEIDTDTEIATVVKSRH